METNRKIVTDYLETTELDKNGIYKLNPYQAIFSYMEWLTKNYKIEEKERSNKEETSSKEK